MEQIRQGAKLNPVDAETDSVKSSGSSNGGGGGGRDALLTQIRKGVELRKVEACEKKAADGPEPVGMAAALKKALEMRQKMMNSDSEDESGSSCPDEEEWADEDWWVIENKRDNETQLSFFLTNQTTFQLSK